MTHEKKEQANFHARGKIHEKGLPKKHLWSTANFWACGSERLVQGSLTTILKHFFKLTQV